MLVHARGVSGDGTTVVGYSGTAGHHQAIRWTPAGLTPLGYLAGDTYSEARGISADGTTADAPLTVLPPQLKALEIGR